MQPAPMKIGMYFYRRMMTSKSDPVVVTVAPGRISVVAIDHVILDAPAQHVQVKAGKASGTVTLTGPQGKVILAGLGSPTAPVHSPEQVMEVQAAQQIAARDPQTSQLELGRMVWVGRQHQADGTKQGGLASVAAGDAGMQRRVGGIVAEAMIAAGAQPA